MGEGVAGLTAHAHDHLHGAKAYALELLGIWLPAVAGAALVPVPTPVQLAGSVLTLAAYLGAVATVVVEGVILCQHLTAHHAYAHVRHFGSGVASHRH